MVNTYTFFGSKLFILKDTFVTRKRKKTFITFEKHINSQLYCIFSFADKSSLTIILPCCLALCTMRMGSLFSELLFIGSGKLCSLRCDVSPPSRLRYHPATQKQPASWGDILPSALCSSNQVGGDPLKMSDPLPKPNWRELCEQYGLPENLIHFLPYCIFKNKIFILSPDI